MLPVKKYCTGCSACVSICVKKCISMQLSNEGFYIPQIDYSQCIHCGKCEQVCKQTDCAGDNELQKVFVGQSKDLNLLQRSSSGGAFLLMAKKILDANGIVYGVAFLEKKAIHIRIDDERQIQQIVGSKYIQSDVNGIYSEVEQDLIDGRQVLFSGTPCQIAALYSVLGRYYDNLICVDFICHGIPSPGIWSKYCDYLEKENDSSITYVEFRNKDEGWDKFSLKVYFENGTVKSEVNQENIYMQLFLEDRILAKACYSCTQKGVKTYSDIRLGDFWTTSKLSEMEKRYGVSAVMINTEKGRKFFEKVAESFAYRSIRAYDLLAENRIALFPARCPRNREQVLESIMSGGFTNYKPEMLKSSFVDTIFNKIVGCIRKIKTKVKFYE